MDSPRHRVAVVPGDGIGREVVAEGVRVLEAAGERFGIAFDWCTFDWSCERFLAEGRMMPADGLDRLRDFDAVFLGAVGDPEVPDHVSLWEFLIPIRREFDQYVNLRPVRLFEGVPSPLTDVDPRTFDFVVVRENTEGEYSRIGGRMFEGTDRETVVQQTLFTRVGVDRILDYAFRTAKARSEKHVTSATKSNGIYHAMPYWDERFSEASARYPGVRSDQYHVDALAAAIVRDPARFDVVVASNLLGDILSDLGPALAGGLGIAPSANLNPEGESPSMFEPVHGSAPDIAGQGVANPLAQILSGAMMLEHLGHSEAAESVEGAVERVLAEGGPRTPDLGGSATTGEVGGAVAKAVTGPPPA